MKRGKIMEDVRFLVERDYPIDYPIGLSEGDSEKDSKEPPVWMLVDLKPPTANGEEEFAVSLEFPTRQATRDAQKFCKEYVAKWGNIDFAHYPESLDTPYEQPVSSPEYDSDASIPDSDIHIPVSQCPFCEQPEHTGDCVPSEQERVIGKITGPIETPTERFTEKSICPRCQALNYVAPAIKESAGSNVLWKCKSCGEYSPSTDYFKEVPKVSVQSYTFLDNTVKGEPFWSEICHHNPETGEDEAFICFSGGTATVATRRAVKAARELLKDNPEGELIVWVCKLKDSEAKESEREWVRDTKHVIKYDPLGAAAEKVTELLKQVITKKGQILKWFRELSIEQEGFRTRTSNAYNSGYGDFVKASRDNPNPRNSEDRLRKWVPFERVYMDGWNAARREALEGRKPLYWFQTLAEDQAEAKYRLMLELLR